MIIVLRIARLGHAPKIQNERERSENRQVHGPVERMKSLGRVENLRSRCPWEVIVERMSWKEEQKRNMKARKTVPRERVNLVDFCWLGTWHIGRLRHNKRNCHDILGRAAMLCNPVDQLGLSKLTASTSIKVVSMMEQEAKGG